MDSAHRSFDVIIIGASVAGSSLAIRLGREGLRVALVDKAQFPRRKPCGEGLSRSGINLLREVIGDAALASLPHYEFSGYDIVYKGSRLGVPFKRENANILSGRGIQRRYLDRLLCEKAATFSGVSLFLGSGVRDATQINGFYRVQCESQLLTAPWLVLADGANSVLAAKLGFKTGGRGPLRYGYSMIAEGDYTRPLSSVTVFLHEAVEVICTPVGPHQLNISAFVEKSAITTVTSPGWVESVLREVESHLGFRCQSHDQPLAINIVHRARRQSYSEQVILVGDCCETLDPIGGMGMTHALHSSKFAAEALTAIIRGRASAAVALAGYARRREKAMRPLRGFTRLTHFLLRMARHTPLLPIISRTTLMQSVSRAANSSYPARAWPNSAAMLLIICAGL